MLFSIRRLRIHCCIYLSTLIDCSLWIMGLRGDLGWSLVWVISSKELSRNSNDTMLNTDDVQVDFVIQRQTPPLAPYPFSLPFPRVTLSKTLLDIIKGSSCPVLALSIHLPVPSLHNTHYGTWYLPKLFSRSRTGTRPFRR